MWILDDAGQSQCIFLHCEFCLSLFICVCYTDFQLWLKKRGKEARVRILHKSCPFCICHPISTPLACLCPLVSEPKQKVRWRQLHRRRKTLFWTTHRLAYFRNTFQNHLELPDFTWLLLKRPEFMLATLLQWLQSVHRDKHADTLTSPSLLHLWMPLLAGPEFAFNTRSSQD